MLTKTLPIMFGSYNKTVHVEMISDPIAWNIVNLIKPIEWNTPQQAISSSAKVSLYYRLSVLKLMLRLT